MREIWILNRQVVLSLVSAVLVYAGEVAWQ